MGENIQFVKNYNDLSTDKGFQFEFFCDRCGTGYRTRFNHSTTGVLSSILGTVGSLLGGGFGQAADVGERLRSASWHSSHDNAFAQAVTELKPEFIQCPRCSTWVCRKSCWNDKRGLCKECAPDMAVELSAAQSSRAREEIWAHAQMSEDDLSLMRENKRTTVRASCPQCEAPLDGQTKFCPECGAQLNAKLKCKQCNAELPPKTKFCPDCGGKVEK